MRFSLFAIGASAAALAPRETYGTWNVHVKSPVCHVTYGCRQIFDIDGKGDSATGRPDILFAGCALGGGCTVDVDQWGGTTYSLINRVNEPEGYLTVTQIYWDATNEYRASGSVPFTGDAAVSHTSLRDIINAYDALRNAGAEVKIIEIAPLNGLEVDRMSHIARVINSGFKTELEAYLRSLETSKVRTLNNVMEFMRSHADVELPKAIQAMRDFGQRQAIDYCLKQYGVDAILSPADSEIDDYYTAVGKKHLSDSITLLSILMPAPLYCCTGYPMTSLPLSYLDFNCRPLGIRALASKYQEGTLIQLISAWTSLFGKRRQVPACLRGYPEEQGHDEVE
ncbi:hypothetical protein GGR58DRAFT_527840 [Xylaria digitata]|nr:hypothetical protein GGR58DRAFT_527840 [Xylaria digitata]